MCAPALFCGAILPAFAHLRIAEGWRLQEEVILELPKIRKEDFDARTAWAQQSHL